MAWHHLAIRYPYSDLWDLAMVFVWDFASMAGDKIWVCIGIVSVSFFTSCSFTGSK